MSNYQLFLDNANAHNDIKNCICKVFSDIGKTIDLDKMIFEYQPMGHNTPKFNNGNMYIYSFWFDGENVPLKIGKAGSKSKARYTSQHYNKNSTKSCLAKSIAADTAFCNKHNINANTDALKKWIHANCHRLNIIMPYDPSSGYDMFTLELIEAILHNMYPPKYEG